MSLQYLRQTRGLKPLSAHQIHDDNGIFVYCRLLESKKTYKTKILRRFPWYSYFNL